MKTVRELVALGRVLHEDDDFVTLEVAKHEDVTFTLQRDENGETVGGDRFLTLLFVHPKAGKLVPWKPWQAD